MAKHAYRLPRSIWAQSYYIELFLEEHKDNFLGKVLIQLRLDEPTKQVELHAKDILIEKAMVQPSAGLPLDVSVDYRVEKEVLIFHLPQEMKGVITLSIQYQARFSLGLNGLYRAQDGQEKALCTQCQPTSARKIFPCLDEPEYKATLQWTLHTPKHVLALTNGALEKKVETDLGISWYFKKTRSISTYLAAVVVGDFESEAPDMIHDVPLQVFALRGKKSQTHFAKELTKKLMPWYEEYFGIPYPYQKYDQVAVPGFDAGAMENIGLVLFRQSALLLDKKTASWRQEKRVVLVVAHEFAHMWFGNWVTLRWWDDLWLNEAFAEWMCHKAIQAVTPQYQMWDDFQESRNHAMSDDALPTTHSIWTPAETPEQATEMFDSITYEKGCAVLRMLEHFLGEAAFQAGIQAYMKKFGENNAQGKDLWTELSAASSQDVLSLMESWITQPGFPVVSVSSISENQIRFKQQRFFSSKEDQGSSLEQQWNIPIVLRFEDNTGIKEHRFLFTQKEQMVSIPSQGKVKWLYANAGEVGFYKTTYDHTLRTALLEYGLSHLDPVEQVGFLEGQWGLVQNGQEAIAPFLAIVEKFSTTSSRQVIRVLSEKLSFIEQILHDRKDEKLIGSFRQWIKRHFFAPKNLSFAANTGISPEQSEYQASLLAILARLAQSKEWISFAEQGALHERNQASSVNADLAGTLVGLAAYFGNDEEYQKYVETYLSRKQNNASPQETLRYLYVLPLFRDPTLVQKTLTLIENKTIPQESIRFVLKSMMGERHSQEATWAYIKANWTHLKEQVGDMGLSHLVESVGGLPAQLLGDVETFFSQNPPLRAERALARGIKRMRQYDELLHRLGSQLTHSFQA